MSLQWKCALSVGASSDDHLAVDVVDRRRDEQQRADHPPERSGAARTGPARPTRRRRSAYWFTPLARKPPSTTSTSPVTKLAARRRGTPPRRQAPRACPKRFIGVRTWNSRPRSVPSSRFWFSGVRNTPGAIALTQTPCGRPLDRELLGQRRHRRLARAVRRDLEERHERAERGDVHDAAVAALDHVAAEHLRRAQRAGEVRLEDRIPVLFRRGRASARAWCGRRS